MMPGTAGQGTAGQGTAGLCALANWEELDVPRRRVTPRALSEHIARLFEVSGLSVREIARRSNLPPSTVHDWARGTLPKNVDDLRAAVIVCLKEAQRRGTVSTLGLRYGNVE